MTKNIESGTQIYQLFRKQNSSQLLNLKSALSKLASEKFFSHLAIQAEQEIDIIMFFILFIRYAALLIALLYFEESINLI